MTTKALSTYSNSWERSWRFPRDLQTMTRRPGIPAGQEEGKKIRIHDTPLVPKQAELSGVTIEQQRK